MDNEWYADDLARNKMQDKMKQDDGTIDGTTMSKLGKGLIFDQRIYSSVLTSG